MNIEALISKAAQEAVKALYGMDATEKMVQYVWVYRFGYELLMLNGLLTFGGLYFTRKNPN